MFFSQKQDKILKQIKENIIIKIDNYRMQA